jgi:hypothetical protein
MVRKPKIPNKPYIHGADGRPYLNPVYFGFEEKDEPSA